MSFKDRTNEFHSMVDRIRSRNTASSTLERRSLLSSPKFNSSSNNKKPTHHSRSEFSLMAGEISRNITNTAGKLEKLTKLAKRKTLFDDKPVEIGELTFIIKQDIAKLNKQIAMLQEYTKGQRHPSKQATEHTSNVVVSLQSKLADTSMNFKDVLEIRTENMKMSKDKRDQFLFSTAEQNTEQSFVSSPLLKSRRRGNADSPPQQQRQYDPSSSTATNNSNSALLAQGGYQPQHEETDSTLSLGIPMITPEQQQQQQQLMLAEQDRYIEHRSTAIESIESTIAELGGIFQQLATMVAEQRESVQRIDQNTEDIEMNVMGAQRELLKYYTNISSNRWLMIKIFATIILFFLLFTLIM
ncbi:t-SNARE [Circinella umbellata]|nr:t-SNARE [Circinella umbellata]